MTSLSTSYFGPGLPTFDSKRVGITVSGAAWSGYMSPSRTYPTGTARTLLDASRHDADSSRVSTWIGPTQLRTLVAFGPHSGVRKEWTLSPWVGTLEEALDFVDAFVVTWQTSTAPEELQALQVNVDFPSRYLGLSVAPAHDAKMSLFAHLLLTEAARVGGDAFSTHAIQWRSSTHGNAATQALARVMGASASDFRTPTSLAQEMNLPESDVISLLEAHTDLFRRALAADSKGRDLWTLRSRKPKFRELYAAMRERLATW